MNNNIPAASRLLDVAFSVPIYAMSTIPSLTEEENRQLSIEQELLKREMGTSKIKARAFIMPDSDSSLPFPSLVYEDITIVMPV